MNLDLMEDTKDISNLASIPPLNLQAPNLLEAKRTGRLLENDAKMLSNRINLLRIEHFRT